MRKKFSAIGNSIGIILDKSILELHGFDRDGDVEITPAPEGGLLIRPAAPVSKRASDDAVKAASAKVKARFAKTFKDLA
jgi:antitoxin component of MazEF toxin-antitoxin module